MVQFLTGQHAPRITASQHSAVVGGMGLGFRDPHLRGTSHAAPSPAAVCGITAVVPAVAAQPLLAAAFPAATCVALRGIGGAPCQPGSPGIPAIPIVMLCTAGTDLRQEINRCSTCHIQRISHVPGLR